MQEPYSRYRILHDISKGTVTIGQTTPFLLYVHRHAVCNVDTVITAAACTDAATGVVEKDDNDIMLIRKKRTKDREIYRCGDG